MSTFTYVRFFEEFGIEDVPLVGGKNASLGEMYQKLSGAGHPRPERLRHHRGRLPPHARQRPGRGTRCTPRSTGSTRPTSPTWRATGQARHARSSTAPDFPTTWPPRSSPAYRRLQERVRRGRQPRRAQSRRPPRTCRRRASPASRRPSSTSRATRACSTPAAAASPASSPTASIHYRIDQGFDHFKVALSIGVMKMVRSDLASSGVMFTLDTESGFRDVVFVTGAYGLGENVVQGAVDPDEFYVHKPTYAGRPPRRAAPAARRQGGEDGLRRGRDEAHDPQRPDAEGRPRAVLPHRRRRPRARRLRRAPSRRTTGGRWTSSGRRTASTGSSTSSRRVRRRSPRSVSLTTLETYVLEARRQAKRCSPRGARSASGSPRAWRGVIDHVAPAPDFRPGEVLVADITTPDWEPVMKTAAAIVTNRGGRTCHAAIIARELGVPAVVGAGDATTRGAERRARHRLVRRGRHRPRLPRARWASTSSAPRWRDLARPRTKIMVNLGNPDLAFKTSFLPNDGVGLARMEFIISESIRAHPLALLHPDKVDRPRGAAHASPG